MSRGNAPFSAVDEAAITVLATCHIETQKAVQELARAIARDRGIELRQPQSDQPRRKRLRRFRVSRDANGDLVGEELDPMGAAMRPPVADVEPASSVTPELGKFADVFGSLEGT